MSKYNFTVANEATNIRIDTLLARKFNEQSRAYFQYLLESNAILVNKKSCKKRYKTKLNDHIEIEMLALPEIKVRPEAIDLDILYEDDSIIVINKAAGMCTHPAPGNPTYTVAGALCHHIKELEAFNDDLRPGIVHRLDKETSGVLIAAKTPLAHRILSASFKAREVNKTYIALCHSCPTAQECNLPIFRDQRDRKKMAINVEKGRASHTTFEIQSKNGLYSLVKAFPTTGRTHQIRVHLKALSSPIIGDKIYAKKSEAERLMLHALYLEIRHPISKEMMLFKAPIPKDFLEYSKKFLQIEENASLIS